MGSFHVCVCVCVVPTCMQYVYGRVVKNNKAMLKHKEKCTTALNFIFLTFLLQCKKLFQNKF